MRSAPSRSSPARLVMHHVGARDGWVIAPLPTAFAGDSVYVLYDADTSCLDHARRRAEASRAGQVQVVTGCLARSDGEAELIVNADPCTSSLLPADPRFAQYTCSHPKGYDYRLGAATQPVNRLGVQLRSLDSLVRAGEVEAPDLLALDTQGTEIDIIEGGLEAIRSRTVAIYTEFAFEPVYAGQRTFVSLHELMLREGFQLFSLVTDEWSMSSQPIGLRAAPVTLFGNALYFRRLDRMPATPYAHAKLALFAAAFGHLDLVFAAAKTEAPESSYGVFLDEVFTTARAMPWLFPPEWPATSSPRVRGLRRIARSIHKRIAGVSFQPTTSPIESVFRKYGFGQVADILKKRRTQKR